MQRKKVDVAVLGAGPGGYPAAIRCRQGGKKVALIEAQEVGGTCLNRGCIPTKTLLKGVTILSEIAHAADFGVHVTHAPVNWSELIAKKNAVVSGLRSGLEGLIQSNGIDLIYGRGTLISPQEIEVVGNTPMIVKAEHIILATGSEPKEIPTIPFDHETVFSSTSLLDLKTLPQSIAVIGGGANGCEFASLFSTLGVKVYIVEMLPRILPLGSEAVSAAVSAAFEKEGIDIICGEKVVASQRTKDGIDIILSGGKTIHSSIAMVSAGRTLNTEALGLSAIGVHTERGAVVTDDRMATNINGIWAIGDITARYSCAHVATHQGLVAAENILGHRKKMYYNAVPGALFTRPEVGSVGYSLEEAKKQGCAAQAITLPLHVLGRAHASAHTDGFVQLIVEQGSGRILGGHAVGYHASELVAEIGLAITNELTVECISDTIHAHPTLAESWLEAALIAQHAPLHVPPQVLSTMVRE